jgi:hypothetical protein
MPVAANRFAQLRVIDHRVRRKAPKRSHCDEYQSDHGDLVP